ncbi:heterokaryon incompatibility protein-domain-containing protein [Hypoxylon sp. NC1633]|nr:heterokaryon incompatibility protein-domain-containing protein [Hypoxylon sp. NC1633]
MSHQSYPAFNYTPLQPGCIRVLRPDIELNGDTTWTMDAIQLEEDRPFDALSYVWGDQSQTFPFICNNQEFRIHHNLSNALPCLAKRDSPRPIWIDALCINQRDEDEKAAQIRYMDRVYRRATQVWIWFGCATEKTSEAISLLPRLKYVLGRVIAAPSLDRPTFQSLGLPSSRDPLWKEVLEISCNVWFERLWVVQVGSTLGYRDQSSPRKS